MQGLWKYITWEAINMSAFFTQSGNQVMIQLPDDCTVVQYPYRAALVHWDDTFLELDRNDPITREFEKQLVKASGRYGDNHTSYEITTFGGGKVYVYCSDSKISFGTKIHMGNQG